VTGALVKMELSRSQSPEDIGRKARGLRRTGRTLQCIRQPGIGGFE